MSANDLAARARPQPMSDEEATNFEELYLLRARILGVLIRDARQAAALSLEACAQCTGVTPETLEAWELGRAMPSLPELELLAYRLGVPVSHFLAADDTLEQERRPAVDRAEYLALRDRLIGALLRSAREERSLTPEVLAEEAGIVASNITAYELGERSIPLPVLASLASACHVPLSYFLESSNRIGQFLALQEDLRRLADLPEEMRRFVSSPTNQPYLDLVMKLAALEGNRLRGIAEAILDITL